MWRHDLFEKDWQLFAMMVFSVFISLLDAIFTFFVIWERDKNDTLITKNCMQQECKHCAVS